VLDEVHHGGDALSWGDAVREAFEPATRRLSLTGHAVPQRHQPHPVRALRAGADGVTRSAADSSYGYADALRDGVVRPVLFLAYSGTATWRTRAGEEVTATLGEPLTVEQTAAAWRTALDPAATGCPPCLAAADRPAVAGAAGGMPDAGGMVIASDHKAAKALRRAAAEHHRPAPVVVLSDDPTASKKIAASTPPTTVAGGGAHGRRRASTSRAWPSGSTPPASQTPLFFAQAVGRFVRRPQAGGDGVGVPAVGALAAGLAAEMEKQRDHALDGPAEGAVPRRRAAGRGQPGAGRAGGRGAGVHRPAGQRPPRPGHLRRR
jgi:superfamily II DNA or RNA helicase